MEPLSHSVNRLLTALVVFVALCLGGAFAASWVSHQEWYTGALLAGIPLVALGTALFVGGVR